ncbi:MAG TPA: hypothetical protein VMB26_04775 [Candidatus Binataceae bacterium]|nr:hypothetical protein [Candidatus Binataceae bacterium]
MANAASLKFPPCVFLALAVLLLAGATVTTPLSRARLNFSPNVNQLHEGISRHTVLEVTAGSFDFTPVCRSFVTDYLHQVTRAQQYDYQVARARQPDNWPIEFSRIYRRIPPLQSGDPELSA